MQVLVMRRVVRHLVMMDRLMCQRMRR